MIATVLGGFLPENANIPFVSKKSLKIYFLKFYVTKSVLTLIRDTITIVQL